MMPYLLSKRQPDLVEYMDQQHCDPKLLENTYRQFNTINRLISGWNRVYEQELKPLMKKGEQYSLLDIGFGGGDVPHKIVHWAQVDGIELKITAIDTDERALQFAQQQYPDSPVDFKFCSSSELNADGSTFDFVISNHLLHHLGSAQTQELLEEAEQLARIKVVFSDIERSDMGYFLFSSFAPLLFRRSFIVADGKISIKRSYTKGELRDVVPLGWSVQRQFPFRLLLTYEKLQD